MRLTSVRFIALNTARCWSNSYSPENDLQLPPPPSSSPAPLFRVRSQDCFVNIAVRGSREKQR